MEKLNRFLRNLVILSLLAALMACSNSISENELAENGVARGYISTPTGHILSFIQKGAADGQRIIFIHGTPGSADNWLQVMKEAPLDLDVIAIDRPGFGATRPRNAVTSLKTQAAALEPLLVTKNGKKPILVGHSLGGPIVAAAAVLFKDRIGGIVIAAGALDPELEKIHPMQYVGATPPIKWLLPRHIKNANQELMALKPELEALAEALDQIDIPVEIVHGTKDDLVPYENVPFMQAHFKGTEEFNIDTLNDVNHFLPWNSIDHIWSAVKRITSKDAFETGAS